MIRIFLGLLAGFSVILGGCFSSNSKNAPMAIELSLRKKLTVGMHFEEIKRVLDSEKVEYSWIEKEQTFHGIVRDVKKDLLGISESVEVIVTVDKDGRLKTVTFERVFTGP